MCNRKTVSIVPKVLCWAYIRPKINVGGNSFTWEREYLKTVFGGYREGINRTMRAEADKFLRDIVEGGLDVVNWEIK